MTTQDEGLDDLYQEVVLDHYKRPRNQKMVVDADLRAEGFNPFCGDRVVLSAKLGKDGHVSEVGFSGQGCAISQASASIMTEQLKGKTPEEADKLVTLFKSVMQGKELTEDEHDTLGELAALEGVRQFPVRIKCALLAWVTLHDAVNDYHKHAAAKK